MQENREHHVAETKTITLDQLQARLVYFMNQYSLHPCRQVAKHIVSVLTHLCQHPHIELIPVQQQVYSRSLNLWRSRMLPDNQSGRSRKVH